MTRRGVTESPPSRSRARDTEIEMTRHTRLGSGARAALALPAVALLAAFAVSGCGSNESAVAVVSPAAALAEEGWAAFGEARFLDARDRFEDALAEDTTYADAENGLGWVDLLFGLFTDADRHFLRATALGQPNQEAEAGHAIVSEIEGEIDEALAATARALAAAPLFSFSRRPGIDFRDLRLIRARAFLAQGRFLDAKAEVDIVNPSNTVNPGFPTFVSDLLAELERLGELLYDF